MSFYARLTTVKDGDDNGTTWIRVPGVPGVEPWRFCMPLEAELKATNGLITDGLVHRSSQRLEEAKHAHGGDDLPSGEAVVEWLKTNVGQALERGVYHFLSF
jgi:hypothetical protein